MSRIPDLDHVAQVGAAGSEDGLTVRQRLSCLILDRVSGQLARAWIDSDRARDEDVWPDSVTPWLYKDELGAFAVVMN